ncbi:BRCT domain-containing protein [Thalassobaculum sp.]|uniref:BRCT domain-containing protein n=1 Tax=Thalassobaculum sp. TaxID=2022740 RepID=UPI0032ED0EF4
MSEYLYRAFDRARIDDRQVNELLGIAHGLMADGKIDQVEAEYLRKWLTNNVSLTENPIIGTLLSRVSAFLSDGVLDQDEALELFDTLRRFTGGQSHLDGLQKSSELPIDYPPPVIQVDRSAFCFTGTFAFGSRKDCAAAVERLGGIHAPLNKGTRYLVIGVYATGSWAHSSFGRKIEKALRLKETGVPIAIVGEEHWAMHVRPGV